MYGRLDEVVPQLLNFQEGMEIFRGRGEDVSTKRVEGKRTK